MKRIQILLISNICMNKKVISIFIEFGDILKTISWLNKLDDGFVTFVWKTRVQSFHKRKNEVSLFFNFLNI